MRQKSTLGASVAKLSINEDFPIRPAYGTKGTPVALWANYYNIQPDKDLVIYRYHVSVSPEAKGGKLKRIFELLIQEPALAHGATDFKTSLIFRNKVEDGEFQIAYRSEFEDAPPENTRPYRVRIQITGQMEVAALLNYLKTTEADPNFSPVMQMQIIQTLNILLGHYPQADPTTATISSNKHFYFGANCVEFDLGGGLSALRGYFRSIRPGTGRILINVNICHAPFVQRGSLVDLISAFAGAYGRNPWELQNFLKKLRVETTHLPAKMNKAGQKVPRVKTIGSLASSTDGAALFRPPRVSKFAAGPKDVHFWLDNPSHIASELGPRKGEASTKPTSAGYISVYDFFQKCKHCS